MATDPSITTVEPGQFKLAGALTMDTVATLHAAGCALFTKADEILSVDLSDVTHCDSASVALLLEWTQFAKKHQKTIQFNHFPQQMRALIKHSALEEVLS